jgi:hypothetical protein
MYDTATDEMQETRVYHLFDLVTGEDRVIPVLPEPETYDQLEFLGFSPDARRMVWQDNVGYRREHDADSRPALIIVETADLSRREVSYPAPEPAAASRSCFTSQWSPDGRAIYSNYKLGARCWHLAVDERALVYFRTDLDTGRTTVVDGGYAFDPDTYTFRTFYLDGGVRLEQPYACLHAHGCAYRQDGHVDGSSRAWLQHVPDPREPQLLDGAEDLYVQSEGAPPRKVASGWSSSCSGTDIRIIGWVDAGKLLLFEHEGNTYLHAVAANRTAPLPQLTGDFNWLPLDPGDNRLYYTTSDGNGEERKYGVASARK